MTTTINADNGVSSGSAGLKSSADSSGVLALQTNGTTAISINASQGVEFLAGTAALPAITTTGDTNTGIFFPAADTIAFSEGGTEAMRIDSSGNVGIGTSSPSGKFHVSGGRAYFAASSEQFGLALKYSAATSGVWLGSPGTDAFTVATEGGTERMRIDSSGTLLINTTSTSSQGKKLVITDSQSGSNEGVIKFENSASSAGGRVITCNTGYAGTVIAFDKSNTGVGTISVTASNTAYNTSSDYRLKENIAPMTGALAKVALLKPVTFKWKIDGVDDEGFIAHELQTVKPNCVTGAKDATYEQEYEVTPAVKDEQGKITTPAVMGTRTVPVYQGIDTSFLVATLTAAIQELKAINDTQAETINALTARIVALEGQ